MKNDFTKEEKIGFVLRRLIGLLSVSILFASFFSHYVHPWAFIGCYVTYLVWSISLLFESTVFFLRGKKLMWDYSQVNWEAKCKEATGPTKEVLDKLVHLIVLPNYKEPNELLCETIQILAEHTYAKEKYIICLAMEEAEAGCRSKADQLVARFKDSFLKILVTFHPVGIPGEARGKGPNVSWGVEHSMHMLKEYNTEDILITVSDADTHFLNDYFTCLSYTCAILPDRKNVMYGIPISFYGNALDVPAPVRVTDMVWTITVTQQLSTGRHVRFPCSCYSLSMYLANRVGFWDKGPEAIGEDCHMFLKCLFKTNGEARIETIYIPAGCYNVSDSTWTGAIKARYFQMFRHLWGTCDLAYAIQQSYLMKDMPIWPKIWAVYEMFKVRVLPATLTWSCVLCPNIMKAVFPIYNEDPYFSVLAAIDLIQIFLLGPYFVTAIYYELLHRQIVNNAISKGAAVPSQRRTYKHFLFDWIVFPLISLFFFSICSLHVQLKQFFTDNLNYQVAPKPLNSSTKRLEEILVNSSAESEACTLRSPIEYSEI